MKNKIISPLMFYLLSFTWGLPITIVGIIWALIFLITGHLPKRCGYCFLFESRRLKGGFSAGIFIFARKGSGLHLLCHEHGHGVQNCLYGLLMPFIVSIPSSTRYHYRNIKKRLTKRPHKTAYEDIWFEAEATRIGAVYKSLIQ